MNHIVKAFKDKKQKGWKKLYMLVDLHGVIISGEYNRLNVGAKIFNGAIEVLSNWTKREDICLILWSPIYEDSLADIIPRLKEVGIQFDYVNKNPENKSGELCDFSEKFYFDIVFDDKAGFYGFSDWYKVKSALIEAGEWQFEYDNQKIHSSITILDEMGFAMEEYITTQHEVIRDHECGTCSWACPICYEEGCRWLEEQE